MTTLQAVWPAELNERRRAANALTATIHRIERKRAIPLSPADIAELERLRVELALLPCPHWDMAAPAFDSSEWTCESCGAGIAPRWVALNDQERALRRIRRRVEA